MSFAIHLAYSLLRELYEHPIYRIEKHVGLLKSLLKDYMESNEVNELEIFGIKTDFWLVDIGILIKLRPHEITIRTFTRSAVIVALFSLSMLIASGFYPEWSVGTMTMVAILILSLAPMPAFMIATTILMRNDLKEVYKAMSFASSSFISPSNERR